MIPTLGRLRVFYFFGAALLMLLFCAAPVQSRNAGSVQGSAAPTGAPTKTLHSPSGRSATVTEGAKTGSGASARTVVRVFAADGKLVGEVDGMPSVEFAEFGRLFGGDDDVLVLSTWQEHVINVSTDVWRVDESRKLALVLDDPSQVISVSAGSARGPAGILLSRETYDGADADSSGYADQFWTWDGARKTLTPPPGLILASCDISVFTNY